jgi:hypothetical protein
VPAALVAVVCRLLAKRIEERFQTPAEAAAALAPFAVPTSAPWDGAAASPEETLATPAPSDIFPGLDSPEVQPSSNSASALAGTVGPQDSATPISAADTQSIQPRRTLGRYRGVAFRLLVSLGALAAAGLLGAAGWLVFR